jgi:hypothetical protein
VFGSSEIAARNHGSRSLHRFEDTADGLPTEQARERFRASGAYYFPNGGAAAVSDTVSRVNVLP